MRFRPPGFRRTTLPRLSPRQAPRTATSPAAQASALDAAVDRVRPQVSDMPRIYRERHPEMPGLRSGRMSASAAAVVMGAGGLVMIAPAAQASPRMRQADAESAEAMAIARDTLLALDAPPSQTEAAVEDTAQAAEADPAPALPALEWLRYGTDPGNYYCEHHFFTSQQLARAEGSSVRTNAAGEPLAGFLHVPRDPWTGASGGQAPSQAERHLRTRAVVGAAIAGYHDAAKLPSGEPFRFLLTGFGPFGSAQNNPTGDFVLHPENLDAAMAAAFGDRLVGSGEAVAADDLPVETLIRRYVVDTEQGEREILLRAQRLTVDDAALDPTLTASLPAAITDFEAHAVLGMGVHSAKQYEVEFHADDGGLERLDGAPPRHDWSAGGDVAHPDNYSLARALGHLTPTAD